MSRSRSPGYPNFGLPEAILRIRKVFEADRRNPIDREVVAKHIGYSGISGASDKAIATLMHYDLLERIGRGEVRVSQIAVDILHPDSQDQYKSALNRAAFAPDLFKTLKDRFPDNRFSDSALRSFLVRMSFLERAIDPVIRAYSETCQYLAQNGADEITVQSGLIEDERLSELDGQQAESVVTPQLQPSPASAVNVNQAILPVSMAERVLTTGLLSKEANFRLIVSGRIGVKEIERLIKKLELDKEILADADDEATDSYKGSIFD